MALFPYVMTDVFRKFGDGMFIKKIRSLICGLAMRREKKGKMIMK
jgi:hypothetical protein